MTLAFETPQCHESIVSRWDPRWKLAALGIAMLVVACLRSAQCTAVAFAVTLFLTVIARIPWRWLFVRLTIVALFVGLFVVWLPFFTYADGARWNIGPIAISISGLTLACAILFRALTIVTLMVVIWVSCPIPDTLKAAHRLRLPQLIVQLFALTYRYLFLIADELARLRVALRVRGYRPRANAHSFHTAGCVAGTLFVRSFERAERVGHAMRCRGFDGRYRSLTTFRTTWLDVAFFVFVIVVVGSLAGWDWLGRA